MCCDFSALKACSPLQAHNEDVGEILKLTREWCASFKRRMIRLNVM